MRTAVLLLCVCFAGSAPADEKKDSDLFQGTWEVVKVEEEGKEVDGFKGITVFEGNKYTLTAGTAVEKGTFTLDPKAKIPAIDYAITEGEAKGKKQVGIYKIDGDTLTLCLSKEGGDTRPTKFKTAANAPEFTMFTLKRKKK